MLRSYKVMLHPNNKQKTRMFQTADACRFIYNWSIEQQEKEYKENKRIIKDYDLTNKLVEFKNTEDGKWLYSFSHTSLQKSILDACNAYKLFFKGISKHPTFKSYKTTKPSFYVHNKRIEITDTHVKLAKITSNGKAPNRRVLNWVRMAQSNYIPLNVPYYDCRVSFDGLNWWLSLSVEEEVKNVELNSDGIGIYTDYTGNLITTSDGMSYPNITSNDEIKRLETKINRLTDIISTQYKLNGGVKSNRVIKNEDKLRKAHKRIVNIRNNYLHKTSREIINKRPKFIVFKKPNMNDNLFRSRSQNKQVYDASIYRLSNFLAYKAEEYNIPVYVIDDYIDTTVCPECKLFSAYTREDILLGKFKDKSKCNSCKSDIDYKLQNAIALKKSIDNNTHAFTLFSDILDNEYL